jgi:gas vesicle protein
MNTYNEEDTSADGRLMAFVCGVLIGASAALLMAPMRGAELRASLGDASKTGRDRLRKARVESREWAEHRARDASHWAQERAQQANVKGRDALHRATEAVDSAVDRAQGVVNHGAERAHEVTDRARSVLNRGLDNARQASHEAERRGKDTLGAVEQHVVSEPWS